MHKQRFEHPPYGILDVSAWAASRGDKAPFAKTVDVTPQHTHKAAADELALFVEVSSQHDTAARPRGGGGRGSMDQRRAARRAHTLRAKTAALVTAASS